MRLYLILSLLLFSSCMSMYEMDSMEHYNFAYKNLDSTDTASTDYDKFEDRTTFRSKEVRVLPTTEMVKTMVSNSEKYNQSVDNPVLYFPHQIYLEAIAYCEGDSKMCDSKNIILMFTSLSSDGWKLLDYNKFIMLYDDNRVEVESPDAEHETVGGSNVMSIISIVLSKSEFENIANSKSTEARLGTIEFELNNEAKDSFKSLLQLMSGQDEQG